MVSNRGCYTIKGAGGGMPPGTAARRNVALGGVHDVCAGWQATASAQLFTGT